MIMEIKDLEKALEQRDTETIKKLAAIELQTKSTDERISEIEQKLVRPDNGGGGTSHKSVGQQVVQGKSMELSNLSRERGRLNMEVKAIISSLATDANGSAGALRGPAYQDTFVPLAQRRLRVRDLVPQIQISTDSVQVPKQTGRLIAAATVSETSGATKPQSEVKYGMSTVNVTTIAHWVLATRQILDDVPQLMGLIDNDLRYGLAYVEENQLLAGAGTGTDLQGMIPQATAFAASTTVVSPTKIDVLGLAMLQNALAEYPADGIVLHPSDWLTIRLAKASDGSYLFGPPGQTVEPRLFGVPVVETPAITAGKFLVGQFQVAATIYDRWQARVEISTEDSDNFRKNLCTVLAEERLAFAVKVPLALTYGDFAAGITDATS